MSDPFASLFGARGTGVSEQRTVSQSQLRRQAAIAAYRQNIALPDVFICDRKVAPTLAKIIDEEGKELTQERWEEIMRGKPKLIDVVDEKGELKPGVDLRKIHDDIQPERLGLSAEKNYLPIRIIKPRELDVQAVMAEVEQINTIQKRIDAALAVVQPKL